MKTQFLVFLASVTVLSYGVACGATCSGPHRAAVIGRYRLANRLQCQRLCWYQRQCKSFRYCDNSTVGGYNCLVYDMEVSDTETASNGSLNPYDYACASRPCTKSEVCVPRGVVTTVRDLRYRCLSADCGEPPEPANHSHYVLSGSTPGDLSIATCDHGYVPTHRHAAPLVMTCDLTGQWVFILPVINFSCQQTEFHNVTLPFVELLPWPVSDGWQACVRGKFKNNATGLDISFVENHIGALEEAGNVDFNIKIGPSHFVMWNKRYGNTWAKVTPSKVTSLTSAPQAGDSFEVQFRLNDRELRVAVNDAVQYSLAAGSDVHLDVVRYLAVFNDHTLDYVNLANATGCL